jgi:hypothetical protein
MLSDRRCPCAPRQPEQRPSYFYKRDSDEERPSVRGGDAPREDWVRRDSHRGIRCLNPTTSHVLNGVRGGPFGASHRRPGHQPAAGMDPEAAIDGHYTKADGQAGGFSWEADIVEVDHTLRYAYEH